MFGSGVGALRLYRRGTKAWEEEDGALVAESGGGRSKGNTQLNGGCTVGLDSGDRLHIRNVV